VPETISTDRRGRARRTALLPRGPLVEVPRGDATDPSGELSRRPGPAPTLPAIPPPQSHVTDALLERPPTRGRAVTPSRWLPTFSGRAGAALRGGWREPGLGEWTKPPGPMPGTLRGDARVASVRVDLPADLRSGSEGERAGGGGKHGPDRGGPTAPFGKVRPVPPLLLLAGSLAGLAAAVGVIVLFLLALSMWRDQEALRSSFTSRDREALRISLAWRDQTQATPSSTRSEQKAIPPLGGL
jgi:hypothetical protein